MDFGNPIDRNSVALLECERMVRGLELDPWPEPVVAKMDPRFQIHRQSDIHVLTARRECPVNDIS
jgi:hypothetical protein